MKRLSVLLTLIMMALSLTAGSRAESLMHAPMRLNTKITVQADFITMGDLFGPTAPQAEKSVSAAPAPGHRMILEADWLTAVARAHDINWRPISRFDRAVVFRPGKSVQSTDLLDAIRVSLRDQGLSRHVGLSLDRPLAPLMVDAALTPRFIVLDAMFNDQTNRYSALVEITAGDQSLATLTLAGPMFPVVTIPVLKASAEKGALVTSDMLTEREIPESSFKVSYATDSSEIVGKAVVSYLRAGEPITETQLIRIAFAELPVLARDMGRDVEITEADIIYKRFEERGLPDPVLRSSERLLGMTTRRYLPAGTPLRPTDLFAANPVQIPVAVRDVRRGTTIPADAIAWVTINESDLRHGVITDPRDIVGLQAIRTLRTGRPIFDGQVRRPVVIARGENVTIRLVTPQMTLTASGRALDDAGEGESIEIMNLQSRKRVVAKVEGPQLVSVVATPSLSF